MLTRNIFIFCTLAVLLAEADLDAVDGGPQAMSTDQDSTSDEAPTESMKSVSPDQPNDESQHSNGASADVMSSSAEAGAANRPQANDVATADASKSSTEEQDENESPESEEVVKPPPPVQRAAKSNNVAQRKRSKPVSSSKKRTRPFRP